MLSKNVRIVFDAMFEGIPIKVGKYFYMIQDDRLVIASYDENGEKKAFTRKVNGKVEEVFLSATMSVNDFMKASSQLSSSYIEYLDLIVKKVKKDR